MIDQQTLNQLCKRASGNGVGFVAVLNHDGTVTIRRDEEYARSTRWTLSAGRAITYLEKEVEINEEVEG